MISFEEDETQQIHVEFHRREDNDGKEWLMIRMELLDIRGNTTDIFERSYPSHWKKQNALLDLLEYVKECIV